MDRQIARWRLVAQRLTTPPPGSAEDVVRHLLGVQAENASQSAWAVATRTPTPDAGDLADALASGRVLRTHVLRSTWHYVHRDDADWLVGLTGPRVLPLADRGLDEAGLDPADLATLGDAVVDLLAAAPDRTRTQVGEALRERFPRLADRLTGQALMMLMLRLELDRLVCSGAPADGEHTYATWESRVGTRTGVDDGDRDELLGQLALRYLTGHGPATVKDLAYWATLTPREARVAVEAVAGGLESFEHDGRTWWHAPGAPGRDAPADPPAHLLQLLDETYRGYQDSRMVLDVDRHVRPGRESAIGMVLVDGQLVAGMRRTVRSSSVRFDVLPHRPLTPGALADVEAAAARYGRFLGLAPQVVVSPA